MAARNPLRNGATQVAPEQWASLCPALLAGMKKDPTYLMPGARANALSLLGGCIAVTAHELHYSVRKHPSWWTAAVRLLVEQAESSSPWDVPSEACSALWNMGFRAMVCPEHGPVAEKYLLPVRRSFGLAPASGSHRPAASDRGSGADGGNRSAP